MSCSVRIAEGARGANRSGTSGTGAGRAGFGGARETKDNKDLRDTKGRDFFVPVVFGVPVVLYVLVSAFSVSGRPYRANLSHPRLPHQKAQHIYLRGDRFVRGGSHAVAGVAVHLEEDRLGIGIARGGGLEPGGHLANVKGVDALVPLAGGHQQGRIFHSGLDVVVRRVAQQVGELLGIVARTVLGNPVPGAQEFVITHHVQQRHLGDAGGEEVRPLGHGRADEQAAIGAAENGELLRPRVPFSDQPLGGGDEIIENVLFLLQHAGAVPVFPLLAAAAQIGQGVEAAGLEPRHHALVEFGRRGNAEAAIAVEERGIAAVSLQTFLMDQEHADAGAVLRWILDLLDLHGRKIERYFLPPPDLPLAGREIDLVEGSRLVEAGEAKERLRCVRRGDEAGGAEARQGQLALRLAVQAETLDAATGVLQVLRHQQIAGQVELLQRGVLALRNHLPPLFRIAGCRIVEIDGHHPLVGRAEAGGHVQDVAADGIAFQVDVRQAALRLLAHDDGPAFGLAGAQPRAEIHHPQVVDGSAHPVADHGPAAVRTQVGEGSPGLGPRAFLVLLHQCEVLPRVGADAMEADAPGVGVVEVRKLVIKEGGAVRQPLDLAHLVGDLVREPGSRRRLEEIERRVLVARFEEAEGDEPAVGAGLEPRQSRQAAGIDGHRIDQHAGLAAFESRQEHRLLLAGCDLLVEHPIAAHGHAPAVAAAFELP